MDLYQLFCQAVGLLAMGVLCFSYQMKERRSLLIMQTVGTTLFCVHYLLIGAMGGLWLNIICLTRNLIYYNKDRFSKFFRFLPFVLAVIIGIIGALSWENIFSVFIILGLAINTVCLSFSDPQKIRYSLLITCPMVLIYNLSVLTWGGIFNESISIISALIGILRFRKKG